MTLVPIKIFLPQRILDKTTGIYQTIDGEPYETIALSKMERGGSDRQQDGLEQIQWTTSWEVRWPSFRMRPNSDAYIIETQSGYRFNIVSVTEKNNAKNILLLRTVQTTDAANEQRSSGGITSLDGFTTDDLDEGLINLYYTTTRVDNRITDIVDQSYINRLDVDAETLNNHPAGYFLDYENFTNTPAVPTTTTDLPEGTNLYYTNERVDDQINQVLVGGRNITLTYDDTNNRLTIDGPISTGGGGTDTTLYKGGWRSGTAYNVADIVFYVGNFYICRTARTTTDTTTPDNDPQWQVISTVAVPQTTDELAEGVNNLYFTGERVDDRVNDLLKAGRNIELTYNDVSNQLEIGSDTSIVVANDTDNIIPNDLSYKDNQFFVSLIKESKKHTGQFGNVVVFEDKKQVDSWQFPDYRISGLATDSTYLWVVDGISRQIIPHNLSDKQVADGAIPLNVLNSQPLCLAIIAGRFFVTDEGTSRIFIYNTTGLTDDNFSPAGVQPYGITEVGGTIYVSNTALPKSTVLAFNTATFVADSTSNIQVDHSQTGSDENDSPLGLTNDGTKLWNADEKIIYSHTLSTKAYNPNDDFTVSLPHLRNVTIDNSIFAPRAESSDEIPEGKRNLYFSDVRVGDSLSKLLIAGSGISIVRDVDSGVFTVQNTRTATGGIEDLSEFDTDDLAQGTTNLYYNDTLAESAANRQITATINKSFIDNLRINADTLDGQHGAYFLNYENLDNKPVIPQTTDGLTEGSNNLYFTDERVDDRVGSLLVAGRNITITYDDHANTLTIDGPASSGEGTTTDTTLYKGSWAIGVYSIGDIVLFSGQFYICRSGRTRANGQNPSLDTASWQIMSSPVVPQTTDDLTEGNVNLYYTNARVDTRADTRIAATVTKSFIDNLGINALQLNSQNASFYLNYNNLSNKPNIPSSSTDISEGSNLYFTNERVDDRVNALLKEGDNISLTYDDRAGTITIASTAGGGADLASSTTDDLQEGNNNLYFSNERVDDRVGSLLQAGDNITLDYDDNNATLTITGQSDVDEVFITQTEYDALSEIVPDRIYNIEGDTVIIPGDNPPRNPVAGMIWVNTTNFVPYYRYENTWVAV